MHVGDRMLLKTGCAYVSYPFSDSGMVIPHRYELVGVKLRADGTFKQTHVVAISSSVF